MEKHTDQYLMEKHLIEAESIEYLDLPPLRFIGKDVIASGPDAGDAYGRMWGQSASFMPILEGMQDYASSIADPCALMHHDNQEADKQMHYLVGRFMKAGTPVPDGLDYYDLPASSVCRIFYRGEFDDAISQAYEKTRDTILLEKHTVPYPVGYFHAEIYPADNIPENGVVSRFGYLMSCKR